ncbi:MAG TPA: TonB-dependent receptor [Steroidobacteraceae bacterium]|jgi:iron complex outermembrane receptor protein|nr:TonB-dependent receptor [Steroidobacteraceae bacterium]
MKARPKSVATALAVALGGFCLAVQAQEATTAAGADAAPTSASETPLETIVVNGIRGSLELSLARKRDADSVMDVVSAEDIGKLPDKNVADAVQRVPGVNISSGSGGEGGFSENDRVSIRGTNPSLTQTTVNGHSIATGDWYIGDQTNTVGRSVSFTLLPAEIVGAVEVQKSSQADYIEGGTVGNVNIVTRTPLSFKKSLTVELTAQALRADLPQNTDPQVNGLINWKNTDGTFGLLLQGFYEARHERRDGQELFLLGEGQIGTVASGDPVAIAHPDLAGVVYPTQIGSAAFTQHSRRTGGLTDFQWQPSDKLTLDLNGFYSHFNGTNFDTNFMASPLNELGNPTTPVPPSQYTVVNGTLVAASFPSSVFDPNNPSTSAFPGVRDSIYRPNAASSAAYVDFDVKYNASDSLLLTAKLGYTRGTGETPHDYGYEAYLINSPLVYQMHGTSGPAIVSFPGVDTTNFNNPANVTNGGSWSDSVKVTDQETYAQADGLLNVNRGILQSAKFGLRYAKHDRSDYGVNYACAAPADTNNPCLTNPNQVLPPPAWNGTVSPGNFGSGIGMGPGYLQHFWVLDPNAIAAWESTYNSVLQGPNYQGNFTIDEKDTAGYVMANLAGDKWRGNVGLRLVDTRQLSNAYSLDQASGNFLPTSSSHEYFDFLPSANLRFDLSPTLVGRLAASRTMSRADYSSLSPAVILNNLDLTGTGGNADLKPIRSNNLDAALEWYFAPQSILSVGVFYMDLPSYVTYGYNSRPFLNTTNNQIANFIVTSPFNVAAHNHGVEFSWQQPLWGGFGALANYTYADGHSANGTALVGSSKSTGNAEVYYEQHGFSARLAYTYRSSFLVGLANVTSQYEAGIGTLAASVNYTINDHLMLTFDGLNLNDPVLKYYSNAQQPQAFYTNGRQYYLGVRLSL